MRVEHATDRCTECGGEARVVEGEAVCQQCGLVVADQGIDHGPEWRSLDDGVDRRRTGSARTRTRHDRGLSTRIGFGDGATVGGYWSRQLVRMRRQHRRAQVGSTRDRNKIYAFMEIQRLVVALGLPEPLDEQSCVLFESAQEEGLLYGRTIEGFAAAAVYAGCRTRSVPRTMAEVTTVAKADRDELKAAYSALNRELGLRTGPIHPREFLPRYASTLELSPDVETRAREFAAALTEDGMLCGKKPNGVAAACLYAAAEDLEERITQAEAADVAGVSQMTVRSTLQTLR